MLFVLDILDVQPELETKHAICQLQDWIEGLPSYIKALFPKLSCES